ncbi:MAG TPA: polyhydroxyalkanoic acid system family protein [Hyphomicrobiaceae bacterium]|nr:polyhydroxyalkanoic acid system family protein [Hyphomicrobiaceae bacterium]
MTPVVITISHTLGKEEVVRRLRPALGQAAQTFPVIKVEQETWNGDRMDFRVRSLGQSIAGNVEVREDSVRLEVTLPWLLAKFANAVQRTIAQRGRILLEKK